MAAQHGPAVLRLIDVLAAPSAEAGDGVSELEAFFAAIEKRAYRMAYIATGDREEALDILQDSMLRMVRKYRSSPTEAWRMLFYRILTNRINDWHRRARIRSLLVFGGQHDDYVNHPADDRQQPLRLVENHETIVWIERALRQLSPRQQQVFLLRCWEGLDVNDTAQVLGCSPGSVKTHLFRALRILRDQTEALYEEK